MPLGELAAAEQVSAPTMTRIVRALEAGGLVRRRRDARDGRAVRLQATAVGRRVLEAGRLRRVQQVMSLLKGVEDHELAPLEQAVALLEEVLADPERAGRPDPGTSTLRTRPPR
ncbi:MAG: MarR family transcriptional regulator [Gemmatimonadetes bacterium]|nr:MarR family transcriptional regulator [Gemmatimonadota bacterium]